MTALNSQFRRYDISLSALATGPDILRFIPRFLRDIVIIVNEPEPYTSIMAVD